MKNLLNHFLTFKTSIPVMDRRKFAGFKSKVVRGLKKQILCVIILSLFVSFAFAQNLNVGLLSFEEFYRRSQVLGHVDSTISFTVRPLSLASIAVKDSNLSRLGYFIHNSPNSKAKVQILPLLFKQQYYSNPTSSRNDGFMLPTKGYQTLVSTGAYAQFGPLSIQLRPEFIYAGNEVHDVRPYHFGNMDMPAKFGSKPLSQIGWGQSSIRLDFGPLSMGLSNENLWWGPGIQNSLLMSNSAAGFKHLTLNTNRPVQIPVGSFEAQIIAGRLEGSGFNTSLPKDWRYLSGLAFTFQPKWIPGLFFGLTRSFQIYNTDMDGSFGDLFPFFQAYQKENTNEDAKRRDQLTSVFSRFIMPKSKSEIYFEYGLNDHSANIRDFLMSPEHSRSYLLGMNKLIPYKQRESEFIQFSAEIIRMEQSIDRVIREAGEWYTHYQVLHGYTHRGEVLGAGIGPGGNLQTLQVGWVKGLKQIGIQLERFEHNGDLANAYGFSPWIDFSLAAVADWTFNKFLINAKLQGIQSINYQWKDGMKNRPKQNIFNINAQLGLMYSF